MKSTWAKAADVIFGKLKTDWRAVLSIDPLLVPKPYQSRKAVWIVARGEGVTDTD